jgi:hypothetical protein
MAPRAEDIPDLPPEDAASVPDLPPDSPMAYTPPAAPKAKPEATTRQKVAALVHGVAQGSTLENGDEIGGALAATFPRLYGEETGRSVVDPNQSWESRRKTARDYFRARDREDLKAAPKYAIGGRIIGGAMTGELLPGAGVAGVSKAQRLAEATLLAATTGYGASESEDPRRQAYDTAVGGLMAPVGAGAVEGAGRLIRGIPTVLERVGESMGYRYLRDTPGLVRARKVPEGIGRAAYDEGAIVPGTTVLNAEEKLKPAFARRGQDVGNARGDMENAGFEHADLRQLARTFYERAKKAFGLTSAESPRPTHLMKEAEGLLPGIGGIDDQIAADVARVDAALQQQGVRPGTPAYAQMRAQAVSQLPTWDQRAAALTPGKPVQPSGNLGWTQGESIKSDSYKQARDAYDRITRHQTPVGEVKKEIGGIYNDAGEAAANTQASNIPGGDDLYSKWLAAKQKFGGVKDAFVTAEEGANRHRARSLVGLTPYIAAAGAGAVGGGHEGGWAGAGKGAAGAALALHLLKTRGASTASAAGFFGSDLASKLSLDPATQAALARYATNGLDVGVLARAAAQRVSQGDGR